MYDVYFIADSSSTSTKVGTEPLGSRSDPCAARAAKMMDVHVHVFRDDVDDHKCDVCMFVCMLCLMAWENEHIHTEGQSGSVHQQQRGSAAAFVAAERLPLMKTDTETGPEDAVSQSSSA